MFNSIDDELDTNINGATNKSNDLEMKDFEDICEKLGMEGWYNILDAFDSLDTHLLIEINANSDPINTIGE